MNPAIATAAVAANQAQTVMLAQTAMVKQAHEAQTAIVDMLAQAVESAPTPEGVGGQIDRMA